MTAARRWLLWIVLLVITAGIIVFDPGKPQGGAIVDAVPRRAGGQPPAEASGATQREKGEAPMILALKPRSAAAEIDDAFAARDWRPPPPPPAKLTARPQAVAPPLPYTVLGKMLDNGAWQVFLSRNDRILVVKSLDTIDNAYRVEEIRPPTMTLTYLPTQQRQTLPIGGAE
jgi:hypothetical protein